MQGEDHPGFPHRGAEDRDEGAEGAGQEGVTSTFYSSSQIKCAT